MKTIKEVIDEATERSRKILAENPGLTTEKKVSHTPGPWAFVTNDDGTPELGGGITQYATISSDAGFGSIAHVIYKKTNILGDSKILQQRTFEANAKLIAAAPELLEALRGMVGAFKALDYTNPQTDAMDKAIEAIKKANL